MSSAAEDERAADREQRGGRERLQDQEGDGLTEDDAVVGFPRVDVLGDERVAPLGGEAVGALGPIERRMARDLFEPRDQRVLLLRLGDARDGAATPEAEEDDADEEEDHRRERDQRRMVRREENAADGDLQGDEEAVEEEHRRALLQGEHVEEAIHELGAVIPVDRRDRDARQTGGEIARDAHEEALLDALDDPRLRGAKRGGERERDQHEQAEDGDRLREAAEGDRADEHLDADRRAERRDPDADRVDDDDVEPLLLERQESEEPPDGVANCVGGARFDRHGHSETVRARARVRGWLRRVSLAAGAGAAASGEASANRTASTIQAAIAGSARR